MENKKYYKIKNCPICNKEQTYSSCANYNRAIKLNTLCKSCNNKIVTEQTKEKIRRGQINKPKSKEHIQKMIISLKETWKNKSKEEMDSWKAVVSMTSKDRWKDEDYKNKNALAIKNSWDSMSKEERHQRYLSSLKGGATRCKYMETHGYDVLGYTEKRYIEYLIKENKSLPIKEIRAGETTPYGIYFPDFDFGDYYVEIKSEWTYKIYNEENNNQRKKLEWTNNNVKQVKILVENKSGQFIEKHIIKN
jgi:hypothetical protein